MTRKFFGLALGAMFFALGFSLPASEAGQHR
jgi:hypothetical protein